MHIIAYYSLFCQCQTHMLQQKAYSIVVLTYHGTQWDYTKYIYSFLSCMKHLQVLQKLCFFISNRWQRLFQWHGVSHHCYSGTEHFSSLHFECLTVVESKLFLCRFGWFRKGKELLFKAKLLSLAVWLIECRYHSERNTTQLRTGWLMKLEINETICWLMHSAEVAAIENKELIWTWI